MFYIIGIVVTLFLSTILIGKKGKSEADWILVIWLVVMAIHLASFYLLATERIFEYPYLLGLMAPFPLLHGPFLYLYTETVTNQIISRKWRVLHFLPIILIYLIFYQFFLLTSDEKVAVYRNKGQGFETQSAILLAAIFLSGIVYVALSLWILKKHRRRIRDQFSYAEKINLAWLRYLIYGIGVIWMVVIFVNDDPAIYSTVVVFVILLGYFGIKQVGIFTQKLPVEPITEHKEPPEDDIQEETSKAKYQKSSVSPEVAEKIRIELTRLMDHQKPFTNPELTLAQLAEALSVQRNNLSQVINTYENKTFYDYINLKRVEEFKRIVSLPESQKFTLLGLANNCGFNSKTSFNRNFKSATGLSPSEYLKQANIHLVQ